MAAKQSLLRLAFLTAMSPACLHGQAPLQLASLGQCPLISGAVIQDCKVGYRVFGAANARAGTVLVPTWLIGRSADWIGLLGPNGLVDSTRYQVVVVDALGNGTSSSPSTMSPRTSEPFPELAIEDMVATQYRVAREALALDHLLAVVGVSMGGIQVFEWAASHEAFVDRFISIVGTPRATRHDRLWLRTQERVIENGLRYSVPHDTVLAILAGLHGLVGVREAINRTDAGATDSLIWEASRAEAKKGVPLKDLAAQTRAIIAYNFYSRPGGADARIASLRNRFLIVGSPDDRVVSYQPAVDFARNVGADTLLMPSTCGHSIFRCETASIGQRVAAFLRN